MRGENSKNNVGESSTLRLVKQVKRNCHAVGLRGSSLCPGNNRMGERSTEIKVKVH